MVQNAKETMTKIPTIKNHLKSEESMILKVPVQVQTVRLMKLKWKEFLFKEKKRGKCKRGRLICWCVPSRKFNKSNRTTSPKKKLIGYSTYPNKTFIKS